MSRLKEAASICRRCIQAFLSNVGKRLMKQCDYLFAEHKQHIRSQALFYGNITLLDILM